MKIMFWLALFIAMFSEIHAAISETKIEPSMIIVSYGEEGKDALFVYELINAKADGLICRLVSEGKDISVRTIRSREKIPELAEKLFSDFARMQSQFAPKEDQLIQGGKCIRVEYRIGKWHQAVELGGGDEALAAFIYQSQTVRSFFSEISTDQAKRYRLVDESTPLSQIARPSDIKR